MCGRFTLRASQAELAKLFETRPQPELPLFPRFNIAPTQSAVVVRFGDAGRELASLRWGLIPSWAQDAKLAASLINARSETVAEKPAFRAAFRRRRCLVPADGFYEWQKQGRARRPHHLQVQGGLFAMAGLWESWRGGEGAAVETFTVLTTEANALLRPLHDRMPVILPPQAYAAWLDPAADPAALALLLKPFPAEQMTCRPVSSYVNNARHEGPACLANESRLFPDEP